MKEVYCVIKVAGMLRTRQKVAPATKIKLDQYEITFEFVEEK